MSEPEPVLLAPPQRPRRGRGRGGRPWAPAGARQPLPRAHAQSVQLREQLRQRDQHPGRGSHRQQRPGHRIHVSHTGSRGQPRQGQAELSHGAGSVAAGTSAEPQRGVQAQRGRERRRAGESGGGPRQGRWEGGGALRQWGPVGAGGAAWVWGGVSLLLSASCAQATGRPLGQLQGLGLGSRAGSGLGLAAWQAGSQARVGSGWAGVGSRVATGPL